MFIGMDFGDRFGKNLAKLFCNAILFHSIFSPQFSSTTTLTVVFGVWHVAVLLNFWLKLLT